MKSCEDENEIEIDKAEDGKAGLFDYLLVLHP
jgi:hypothetical protein